LSNRRRRSFTAEPTASVNDMGLRNRRFSEQFMFVCISLVTALPSCSGKTTRGRTPPSVMADWYHRQAESECEKDQRCGASYSSVQSCVDAQNQAPARDWFFNGANYFATLSDFYYLADAGAQQACLAAIAASTCFDATSDLPACGRALVPIAPRGQGERCHAATERSPGEPCVAGLACYSELGACATCGPPRAGFAGLGESCTQLICGTGLICTMGACAVQTWRQIGETCSDSAPCQKDARCEVDPQLGYSICVDHGLGTSCSRAASDCVDGYWCLFSAADATDGVCGLPDSTIPTPCSIFINELFAICPSSSYRDPPATSPEGIPLEGIPSYCLCLPLLGLGAACSEKAQCDHAACKLRSDGTRWCQPLATDNAACTESEDCASGDCVLQTNTCAPSTASACF
jgi:hypothetical protein